MISQKKFRQLQLPELAPENRAQITVRSQEHLKLNRSSFVIASGAEDIAWGLAAKMPGSMETNWMGGRYGCLEAEGLRFCYGRKTGGALVAIHGGLGDSILACAMAERNLARTLCRLGFPFGVNAPYEDVLSYLHRSYTEIFLPNSDEICCLIADVFYLFRFCPELGLFAFTATDISQILLNKDWDGPDEIVSPMENYFANPMAVALQQFGFESSAHDAVNHEHDEQQEPVIGGRDWLEMMVQRLQCTMSEIRNFLSAKQRLTT